MSTLFIDFETYYENSKSGYSLSNPNLTTAEYILNPQFEITGVSYAIDDDEPKWFFGDEDLRNVLAIKIGEYNPHVVAHNAIFEGSILEWVLGFRPARYFCTMMASNALVRPFTHRVDLDTVAGYYGIQNRKQKSALIAVANVSLANMTAIQRSELSFYGLNDVVMLREIYNKQKLLLPEDEKDVIDLTIKKYTRPRIGINKPLLQKAKADIEMRRAKARLLLPRGVTEETVMSNNRLADYLTSKQVKIPTKVSAATRNITYAFAKTDKEFVKLTQHKDPEVRNVIEARLFLKSSIDLTRTTKFIQMAEVTDKLPMPLLYYGAHTGRFSGFDGINPQNLPRDSDLRRALVAPEGYKLISADLSSIEARIVATLAGQKDLVEQFRRGEDVYRNFASRLFAKPPDQINEYERFIGKTCILGLGYGLGSPKFLDQMSVKVPNITIQDTTRYVHTYRSVYWCIPELWRTCETILLQLSSRSSGSTLLPCIKTCVFNGAPAIYLPNGMWMPYPDLTNNAAGWSYSAHIGGGCITKKLYGGALLENISQALARIILTTAELRLAKAGVRSVLQVHDELVFCVPDDAVDAVSKAVYLAMCAPPSWLQELPISCKVKAAQSYGDAK